MWSAIFMADAGGKPVRIPQFLRWAWAVHSKCKQCGRRLKSRESMTNGLGPVCLQRHKEYERMQPSFEFMREKTDSHGTP